MGANNRSTGDPEITTPEIPSQLERMAHDMARRDATAPQKPARMLRTFYRTMTPATMPITITVDAIPDYWVIYVSESAGAAGAVWFFSVNQGDGQSWTLHGITDIPRRFVIPATGRAITFTPITLGLLQFNTTIVAVAGYPTDWVIGGQ